MPSSAPKRPHPAQCRRCGAGHASSRRGSRAGACAPRSSSLMIGRRADPACALAHSPARLSAAPAQSVELPRESAVPGGVKLIRLDDTVAPCPTSKPMAIEQWSFGTGQSWVAVIGIPLAAPLGAQQVIVQRCGGQARDRVHRRRQAIRQSIAQGRSPARSISPRPISSGSRASERGSIGCVALVLRTAARIAAASRSPCRVPAAAPSACAAFSTANPAIRIPAWISPRQPAPRCWCRSRARWSNRRLFLHRQYGFRRSRPRAHQHVLPFERHRREARPACRRRRALWAPLE